MSNLNIPQKNPGDSRTAAEDNQITNWGNNPMKNLGAFNPAMTFDSQGQYDDYTLTSDTAITASSIELFSVRVVRITTDGTHELLFGNGIDKVITQFVNPLPSGSYWVYMASFVSPGGGGNGIHVNIPEVKAVVINPPYVESMKVFPSSPNDLVVKFNQTVTGTNTGYTFRVDSIDRTLTGVSGSGSDTLTFTIDGAAIADGEVLDLSYDSSTGNTINLQSSELVSFTQQTVTNSIIQSQDNFAGSTIDTAKWTVTDPVDGVTISQNNELLFTVTGEVTSANTNTVLSDENISSGAIQFDFGGNIEDSTQIVGLGADQDNEAELLRLSTNPNVQTRTFVAGVGSLFDTGIPWIGNTFKIVIESNDDIKYLYLSAPDTWTQMGVTDNESLGANLKARIGQSGVAAETSGNYGSYDNFYMTIKDYATSNPS